jgi:hypothetical protein
MTLSLESLFAKLRNFNGPWAAWKKPLVKRSKTNKNGG